MHKSINTAPIIIRDNNVVDYDKIASFVNASYVSASEGAWRIMENKMSKCSHSTVKLGIHTENEQQVLFTEGREEQAIANFKYKQTTLTEWFILNWKDPEAHKYKYVDIPYHYRYVKKTCEWVKKKKFTKPIVSRMYAVNSKNVNCFYLRLLLLHLKGG